MLQLHFLNFRLIAVVLLALSCLKSQNVAADAIYILDPENSFVTLDVEVRINNVGILPIIESTPGSLTSRLSGFVLGDSSAEVLLPGGVFGQLDDLLGDVLDFDNQKVGDYSIAGLNRITFAIQMAAPAATPPIPLSILPQSGAIFHEIDSSVDPVFSSTLTLGLAGINARVKIDNVTFQPDGSLLFDIVDIGQTPTANPDGTFRSDATIRYVFSGQVRANLVSVPEPSSAWMLATCCFAGLVRRRRKVTVQ